MAEDGTVLVVDDDAAFRTLLRVTLEHAGCRVVEADDGAKALEVALREVPDLVLLDWRMPGQSGIDACRMLRREPALAQTRIAMVTGLDDERDRALARHAGADAFIVKDGDPEALRAQVSRLLESSRPSARSR